MKLNNESAHRRQDLFGGHGEVRVWNLVQDKPMPPFVAVLACALEPGGTVGSHLQERADEIIVIMEGEGKARVNGQAQPLNPGTVVWLPLGDRLELENTSEDTPLRYLIVKALSAK